MAAERTPAALAGLRVLDLSTNHAAYAGRLLADLGADVVRIEPPSGSPVRRLAPLRHLPDGEAFSFAHAFLDAGKRSITIDLATADGRARFAELAAASDVIIETPDGGGVAAADIGFEIIRPRNPGLIVVSISPFGLEGPYSRHRATDLTVLAAGGLLSLGGYATPSRSPFTASRLCWRREYSARWRRSTAVYERTQTGKGQWIDVSARNASRSRSKTRSPNGPSIATCAAASATARARPAPASIRARTATSAWWRAVSAPPRRSWR